MTRPSGSPLKVAVIGAGVAGVTCADRLRHGGARVVVFEKSRGVGGRLANRRVGDAFAFDHGAQYVTARGPDFQEALRDAAVLGAADAWRPALDGAEQPEGWAVGVPGMNGFLKLRAVGLEVRSGTQVTGVWRDASRWRVDTHDGPVFDRFDVVVCTAPPAQAAAIAPRALNLSSALVNVDIAPCWTLMVAYAAPVEPGFDVRRHDDHALSWLCRDSSKPGRSHGADCWVAQASPDWSRQHLEKDAGTIANMMLALLPGAFKQAASTRVHAAAHRWRYARVMTPLGPPFWANDDGTLLVGGDWCLGPRVECAFDSGLAMADAIVAESRP